MLKWLWLSGVIVVLDQISKWLAESNLTAYHPVPVVPSFNLTLMYNTGAAFSFLADSGGWQRWFFMSLSLVISITLTVWLYRLRPGQGLLETALALIIGGAVGNLIDRTLHGHVIDFIQVFYDRFYWPAFNVADSAITIGAALLIIDSLIPDRRIARNGNDPL
jgi:signal peptidase II